MIEPEKIAALAQSLANEVLASLRAMGMNHADAEDIFQNAVTRALKYRHAFQQSGSDLALDFKKWFFGIIGRTLIDAANRRNRQEKQTPSDFVEPAYVEEPIERDRVLQAISLLPHDVQVLCNLRWFHDFSTGEIAERLRCSVRKVQLHLERALQMLHTLLDAPPCDPAQLCYADPISFATTLAWNFNYTRALDLTTGYDNLFSDHPGKSFGYYVVRAEGPANQVSFATNISCFAAEYRKQRFRLRRIAGAPFSDNFIVRKYLDRAFRDAQESLEVPGRCCFRKQYAGAVQAELDGLYDKIVISIAPFINMLFIRRLSPCVEPYTAYPPDWVHMLNAE